MIGKAREVLLRAKGITSVRPLERGKRCAWLAYPQNICRGEPRSVNCSSRLICKRWRQFATQF
jgi:hypothetical protein